jgi:hypothetical protein
MFYYKKLMLINTLRLIECTNEFIPLNKNSKSITNSNINILEIMENIYILIEHSNMQYEEKKNIIFKKLLDLFSNVKFNNILKLNEDLFEDKRKGLLLLIKISSVIIDFFKNENVNIIIENIFFYENNNIILHQDLLQNTSILLSIIYKPFDYIQNIQEYLELNEKNYLNNKKDDEDFACMFEILINDYKEKIPYLLKYTYFYLLFINENKKNIIFREFLLRSIFVNFSKQELNNKRVEKFLYNESEKINDKNIEENVDKNSSIWQICNLRLGSLRLVRIIIDQYQIVKKNY